MPEKQNLEQLHAEIENLKNKLKLAHTDNKPLNRTEMLDLSTLLDKKIFQYMKLQKDKKQKINY